MYLRTFCLTNELVHNNRMLYSISSFSLGVHILKHGALALKSIRMTDCVKKNETKILFALGNPAGNFFLKLCQVLYSSQ